MAGLSTSSRGCTRVRRSVRSDEGGGGLLGGLMGGGADDDEPGMGIGDMMAMAGPMLDPFLENLGRSFRLVRLKITWPAGHYTRKVEFSRLVKEPPSTVFITVSG